MDKKIRQALQYFFKLYIKNPFSVDYREWNKTIEDTIYWFKDDVKIKIFENKYIFKKNEIQICLELSISPSTLYCWENDILETALHFAISNKLIEFDFENHKYKLLFFAKESKPFNNSI